MPPGGRKEQAWLVFLKFVDEKDEDDQRALAKSSSSFSRSDKGLASGRSSSKSRSNGGSENAAETRMKKQKREEREASEVAMQLDIWWSNNLKLWLTADKRGRLYFWDFRRLEGALTEQTFSAIHELAKHAKLVTGYLEIGRHKFCTCSLDRTLILWDNRNMTLEYKIEDHTSSVLCQAYLPLYSSLVSVGCEKKVFVWSIDSTAYRGVRSKLSGHGANLLSVSAGQRVFLTLDEASVCILWCAATLACLQTTNAATQLPKHVICLPLLGRACLAGRRLNFYDGNEQLQGMLGMMPTKEQLAQRQREADLLGSIKERAAPRWCGISSRRGCVLSATEAEVRYHARGNPSKSSVLFNAPEGDSISAFAAVDGLSLVALGTAKGSIHFLKYRSGFSLKAYPGRRGEDAGAAKAPAAAKAQPPPTPMANTVPPTPAAGVATSLQSPVGRNQAGGTSGGGGDAPGRARAVSSPSGGGRVATSPSAVSRGGGGGASSAAQLGGGAFITDSGGVDGGGGGGVGGTVADGGGGAAIATASVSGNSGGGGARFMLQNAPSAEEVQRGLSSQITCILPCEERELVFVGTHEGRILVCAVGGDFPVVRWLHPDDAGAVTCFHYSVAGEGLFVAGTIDGVAHLYNLSSFRFAGSVNIPRLLPEAQDRDASANHGQTGGHMALRHVRILRVPGGHAHLPCSLLTVDAQSRMRFWGFRMHSYSQEMHDLGLLFDGGCLRALEEDDNDAAEDVGRLKASKDGKSTSIKGKKAPSRVASSGTKDTPAEDSGAKAPAAGKDGKGDKRATLDGVPAEGPSEDGKSDGECSATGTGRGSFEVNEKLVSINVVTDFTGEGVLPLPTFKRLHWIQEAKKWRERVKMLREWRAKLMAQKLVETPTEKNKKSEKEKEKEKSANSRGSSAGGTQQNKRGGGGAGGARKSRVLSKSRSSRALFDQSGDGLEDYETDGDDDALVANRYAERPRTPLLRGSQEDPSVQEAAEAAARAAAGETLLPGEVEPPELELPPWPEIPEPPPVEEAREAHVVFLADTRGYIWCLDLAASVSAATHLDCVPVVLNSLFSRSTGAVMLPRRPSHGVCRASVAASMTGALKAEHPSASTAAGITGSGRGSFSGPTSGSATSLLLRAAASARDGDELGQAYLAGAAPEPRPDLVKVVGAWRAHTGAILSLVPVSFPAALVTVDESKDVRVWSTDGDLWSEFTLHGLNGRMPSVKVWPPPHVLSAQLALMSIGKGLTRKLGLSDRRRESQPARGGRTATARQSTSRSKDESLATRGQRRRADTASSVISSASVVSTASTAGGGSGNAYGGTTPAFGQSLSLRSEPSASDAGAGQPASGVASAAAGAKAAATDAVGGATSLSMGLVEDAEKAPSDGASPSGRSGGAGEDLASPSCDDVKAGTNRRRFTQGQMVEMIRNHAFSSGFQNYGRFQRSARKLHSDNSVHKLRGREFVTQLDAQRSSFFDRPADAFGVELSTSRDTQNWEAGTSGLGPRSASEGALLRYVHAGVEDLKSSVRTNLNVDVSTTTRAMIKRPSFAARLDIGNVSPDPTDPNTATGQALRKINAKGPLGGTGAAMLGAVNLNTRLDSKMRGSKMR
eukprot:TRINITY_DN41853_c0_g1_i2.p1 TRINITY_DN41853_c0_g1~~TRINITY_DN41853_c0_g1_i2.p1  ORF type:complete len:1789 (+),score=329.51 TRINITY_DN41853_c0_g1_i2:571-5367(+)